MLTSILAGLAFGASIGGISYIIDSGLSDLTGLDKHYKTNGEIREEYHQQLKNKISKDPVLKDMSLDDLLNRAADMGYINKSDKTRYLNMLKDFDTKHNFFEGFMFGDKGTEEVARLYGILTKVAPEISDVLNNYAGVDVKQTLASSIPQLASAPTPGYFDTDFEGYQRDVDPVKWWTGKELAAHHDLDYDLDSMYNAIKRGTEANVGYGQYQSRYANEASLKDNEVLRAQYLQDLRNTKSDAITSGATAGARDAAELLNSLDMSNNFASAQADVANNRFDIMNNYLLEDAQAAITANQAYQSLGTNIADNIEYLYSNDVDRYIGDVTNNSRFFAADQALRDARNKANADMYASYVTNNALINQAQQGINDINNQYAWMWDRFYGRAQESGYKNNEARAVANNDFFNWVMKDSTGANSYRQLRNSQS